MKVERTKQRETDSEKLMFHLAKIFERDEWSLIKSRTLPSNEDTKESQALRLSETQ